LEILLIRHTFNIMTSLEKNECEASYLNK
jgi:hypothetical protein